MKKILSIDDSLPTQTLIEYTLNREGHNVFRISDEKDALDSLSRESFDLIMLNITSKEIGWANILGNIKNDSRHSTIPVLTLSNRLSEDKTEEASRLGAKDFINKPFKPDELVDAVSRLLKD